MSSASNNQAELDRFMINSNNSGASGIAMGGHAHSTSDRGSVGIHIQDVGIQSSLRYQQFEGEMRAPYHGANQRHNLTPFGGAFRMGGSVRAFPSRSPHPWSFGWWTFLSDDSSRIVIIRGRAVPKVWLTVLFWTAWKAIVIVASEILGWKEHFEGAEQRGRRSHRCVGSTH